MLRQRVLSRTDGVRSDKDLVTVLSPDNRGFLAEERFFGGDVQSVALGELCALPLPASDQYRLVHTYQYGTRATTEYRDAAGAAVLRTLDRDIDHFTGLPRTERDVSGLPTDFIYDALGRLTWVRPAEGAWTRYRFYTAQASTDPNLAARVEVCTKANGDTRDGCAAAEPGWQDTLTRSAYRFNGFGRLFGERTRMPTATYGPEPAVPYEPGASTKWNERRTVYNALGWKTGVSEVAANGSPPKWTTFSNFDPFGRVGTITLPDGTSTTFSYTGVRLISRTVTVSGQPATTTEEYDRQGRLSNVTEPAGTGGSNVTTTYAYDVGDRLTLVVQGGQTRSFAYDGRGFLLWEDLPEKEPVPGQAHDVLYGRYDARGHARWVRDGEVATATLLDRAERPTHLYYADSLGNPVAPMVRWYSYATSNDGANRRQGKLEKAWAKTIQPTASPDPSASAEIEDTFTYAGLGGRISQKKTWVKVAGSAVANPPERNFVQSYTYDALGNVASVSYPWDGSLGPTVPRRRVDFRFEEGRLTSVLPYYATGIAYHYNGMVHQATTGKRVVELQDGPRWQQSINSSTRMARPQEIRSVGVTLSGSVAGVPADWSTGTYAYDGAGDITAMGGESYTYDKVSRLVSSTRNGGESYTFDAFGNLIAMNGLLRTTDPATNRLTEAAYDRRGNLVGWGGYAFTWDTMGRMTSMQGPGINRSMFYDAHGERIVVRDGSTYTFTLRDLGQQVLREVSWSSATGWKWGKDYIYRDGVLLASQSTSAGEGLRYHFPDHLTSPRLLTNRCGERGVEHRLSSFGVDVLSGSSQSADRMRFTMHERDLGQLSTTLDDLDSLHARYYNPNLGRLLSVDPVGGNPSYPQGWNAYAYAYNSPLMLVDPDGRTVESALALIGRYRSEIALASGLTGGQVTPLEIARVVFQENRNDYNWVRGADWTSCLTARVFGGPELKNTAGLLAFLVSGQPHSFGPGEMMTSTAAQLLGASGDHLSFSQRMLLYGLLNQPATALYLVALELQRIKAIYGDVPDPVLLTIYNVGPSRYEGGVNDVGRRSGQYILEIKKALAMDDGTAASTVVRCNGAYKFANQCQ